MTEQRIEKHPILSPREGKKIKFYFENKELEAYEGEVIASALFAHGIHCFGRHHKDDSAQGIFCANGQCAQCLVLADEKPVKSCIVPVKEGMKVNALHGNPPLPSDDRPAEARLVPEIDIDVLIVGGGPAGLSAAVELAQYDVSIIVADDKQTLGGKLALQTHNFFGSTRDCYAGTRGIDIGTHLAGAIAQFPNVSVWLESPVLAVFEDRKVGVLRQGTYCLVRPKVLLVTAGARERNIAFPGCDLPGAYGAGAFQTLVNRDLVKAAKRLFIVGGGNVGLIAAYHAMQAGIEVVGLAEALPACGGYKVHLDKIKRLGVPIYVSHTILRAEGKGHVERVTIARVDKEFRPISGTEKTFDVDTLLIAVGLASVNELLLKAKQYDMKAYGAGDADIVAEASAAMFSGKITARHILKDLGIPISIPPEWSSMVEILRGRPGKIHSRPLPPKDKLVYPNLFCTQEIPCNPCTEVCPVQSIATQDGTLTAIPLFHGNCVGCGRCVAICPGLAITLVDRRYDPSGKHALLMLPWEMEDETVRPKDELVVTGFEGEELGKGTVLSIKASPWQDRRKFLLIEVEAQKADDIAGVRMPGMAHSGMSAASPGGALKDEDSIICRCQRIAKGDIVEQIESGITDINAVKAILGCCMGPCGGKTCEELILRIFREKGISPTGITRHVVRPFTQEVPLSAFLGE